jgi:hypothetical protein
MRRRVGFSLLPARRLPLASIGHICAMVGLVVTLLVIWLVLTILGLAIKGLFWLFVIGLILFVATALFGWVRRGS